MFFAAQRRKMYREHVKQDLWLVVQQLPDTIFRKLSEATAVKYRRYFSLMAILFLISELFKSVYIK